MVDSNGVPETCPGVVGKYIFAINILASEIVFDISLFVSVSKFAPSQ